MALVCLSVPLSLLKLMKKYSEEVLISNIVHCEYTLCLVYFPTSFIPYPFPLYLSTSCWFACVHRYKCEHVL